MFQGDPLMHWAVCFIWDRFLHAGGVADSGGHRTTKSPAQVNGHAGARLLARLQRATIIDSWSGGLRFAPTSGYFLRNPSGL